MYVKDKQVINGVTTAVQTQSRAGNNNPLSEQVIVKGDFTIVT